MTVDLTASANNCPQSHDDQAFAHKPPQTTHLQSSTIHSREPRSECPASPLQQQRHEESDARARVCHYEREDTPPTSLVSTGLVRSSPCPPPSSLRVLFLSANCWRRPGLAFFFGCVVPACLVSPWPLWFRACPRGRLSLVPGCLFALVIGLWVPKRAPPCRGLRWWLALRAPQPGLVAVWGLLLRRQNDPVRLSWLIAHSCSLSWLVVCSSSVRKFCASMSSPRGDALRQLPSQLAALADHEERVQAVILCTLGSLPSALSTTPPSPPSAAASLAAGEASRHTLLSATGLWCRRSRRPVRLSKAAQPFLPAVRASPVPPLVLQLLVLPPRPLPRVLQVAPVDGSAHLTPRVCPIPPSLPLHPPWQQLRRCLSTARRRLLMSPNTRKSPTTRMRTPTRTPPWRRLPRRLHDKYVSAPVVVLASTPCGATSTFFITNLR